MKLRVVLEIGRNELLSFVLVSNATFIIIILGKYGKILKVAVNQSTAYAGTQVSFFIRDEFRKNP